MSRSVHRSPRAETATDGNASCGHLTLNFDPALHERFPTIRSSFDSARDRRASSLSMPDLMALVTVARSAA